MSTDGEAARLADLYRDRHGDLEAAEEALQERLMDPGVDEDRVIGVLGEIRQRKDGDAS